MRTVVMRKTWGKMSPGTPVLVDPSTKKNGYVWVVPHNPTFDEVSIPVNYLTELRERTSLVPAQNRHKRRETKRRAYKALQDLMS